MTRPSRVHPHQFVADPDMPLDHRGRQTCSTCQLVGAQGDAHHPNAPTPHVPAELVAAGRDRDAAILGERNDS